MLKPFTSHPDSVGESYSRHAAFAIAFGGRMFVGALACMLHGLFPFLFQRTGSRIVRELHDLLATHRPEAVASADAASPPAVLTAAPAAGEKATAR